MDLVSNSIAFVGQLTDAEGVLKRLRKRIDSELDRLTKRQMAEALVTGILITTTSKGLKKQSEVEVTYAFDVPTGVVEHDRSR